MQRNILTAKDQTILRVINDQQSEKGHVTLQQVSEITSFPRKTIQRRLAELKYNNLLKSERVFGTKWRWDLSKLKSFIFPEKKSKQHFKIYEGGNNNIPSKSRASLCIVNDLEPQSNASNNTSKEEITMEKKIIIEHVGTSDKDLKNIVQGLTATIVKEVCNNINNILINNNINKTIDGGEVMAKVLGPKSELLNQLENFKTTKENIPRRTIREIQEEKSKSIKDKIFNSERKIKKLREKYESKSPSDYTVTDLRFVFEDAWSRNGYKGFPDRWGGKESKLVSLLVKSQGGGIVSEYFDYSLDNWLRIQKDHKIKGAPSISVLYAFRNTLIWEMQNGVAKESSSRNMIEYDESKLTEKDFSFSTLEDFNVKS